MQYKKLVFIIILIVSAKLSAVSQILKGYEREYSEILPQNYNKSISELRKHINERIPARYKHSKVLERLAYEFSDKQAYIVHKTITGGEVYNDWEELENYVNDVLDKIMPDELKNDSVIHAYIVKDGSHNAGMSETGHMFINIGIFTLIEDEASLATIMAHELAHYYLNHSFLTFYQEETDWRYTLGGVADFTRERQNFSVFNEKQADSLAMIWLDKSDFDHSGLLKSFYILQRLETQRLKQSPSKFKSEKSTHPLPEERFTLVNNFYKSKADSTGKSFLINKQLFDKFKEEAKPEIIKCLLNDFRYYDCIETSFRFHLFDPENPVYTYYIMEAIRRLCYMNANEWNENFITNLYYVNASTEDHQIKQEMSGDFFDNFNLDMLMMTAQDAQKIKARYYWQEKPKKFRTYEQAFNYFYLLGKKQNCKECIFSNALSYADKKTYRDSLLKEYLSYDNIAFRSFATKFLADSLISGLPKKKLLVFNDFLTYINQGQETIPVRMQTENDIKQLTLLFDSVAKRFPDRKPLYMLSLKNKMLNEYRMMDELYDFSNTPLFSLGQKIQLHILEPRYLDIFYKYGVNEIEFFNCKYQENRKSERTVDAYEEATKTSYEDIFKREKELRDFDVYISSVREIENSLMKIKFGNSATIKFNKPGFPEILSGIISMIVTYDDRVKELDYNYRRNN